METKTEIMVKAEDIDELGHVNNSVYVTYLERGRGDWYREAGLSFSDMGKRNLGTVVVKLEISYLKEVTLGERLWVETRPLRLGRTSFVFEQKITNEKGEVVTEATVTSVMFDRIHRKSIPVVDEIARYFRDIR